MRIRRDKEPTGVVRIEASVTWQVARDPDSGNWIGVCRPLNANAIGETWDEFQRCASEAINLLLVDLHADGELDAFLHGHGWKPSTPLPPRNIMPVFDLPYRTEETDPQDLIGAGA